MTHGKGQVHWNQRKGLKVRLTWDQESWFRFLALPQAFSVTSDKSLNFPVLQFLDIIIRIRHGEVHKDRGWAQHRLRSPISILSPCSSHTRQVTPHLSQALLLFLLPSACLAPPAAGPPGQQSALPTCSAKARSGRHPRAVSSQEDLHGVPSEGYTMTCLPCSCRHTQGPCVNLGT